MRYSVKTRLEPRRVIEQARSQFGEEGIGLEATDEGGGGYVSITARSGVTKKKSEVEILTQEWDKAGTTVHGRDQGLELAKKRGVLWQRRSSDAD